MVSLEEPGRNVNLNTQHKPTTKQMLNKRLIPRINSSQWRLTERLVPISLCHSARCSPLLIHSAKVEKKRKTSELQALLAMPSGNLQEQGCLCKTAPRGHTFPERAASLGPLESVSASGDLDEPGTVFTYV